MEGYEIIQSFVRPAYSYVEGDKTERYWVDSQNCYYHICYAEKDDANHLQRKDGKKFWIIEPYKPIGLVITEDNWDEIKGKIKWLVTDTSEEYDEEKEWNFETHCVIK